MAHVDRAEFWRFIYFPTALGGIPEIFDVVGFFKIY